MGLEAKRPWRLRVGPSEAKIWLRLAEFPLQRESDKNRERRAFGAAAMREDLPEPAVHPGTGERGVRN